MVKAVQGGRLLSVSASQIKDWMACKRKWHFQKVIGLKQPDSIYANRGTAGHKQCEDYYLHGTPPTHKSILKAMEDGLLPPRTEPHLAEHWMDSPPLKAANVAFRGKIDLTVFGDVRKIRIVDFKFVGSLNYCKTEDDLREDVQMISYAKYASTRWPECGNFELTHLYLGVNEDKPAVNLVSVEVTREEVEACFDRRIVSCVEQMKETAKVLDTFALPPANHPFEPCRAYGDCPFLARCFITPAERLTVSFPDEEPRVPAPAEEGAVHA